MKHTVKRTITSVKIPENQYEDFKIMSVRSKINLQEIVERTIFMYITDPTFRQKIHEKYSTYYTGSDLIETLKQH